MDNRNVNKIFSALNLTIICIKPFNGNNTSIIFVEILHFRPKFQTAMVSCTRFIWITNTSDHKRIWTPNLLHTSSYLTYQVIRVRPYGLVSYYFVCKRFAVQTLLVVIGICDPNKSRASIIFPLNIFLNYAITDCN